MGRRSKHVGKRGKGAPLPPFRKKPKGGSSADKCSTSKEAQSQPEVTAEDVKEVMKYLPLLKARTVKSLQALLDHETQNALVQQPSATAEPILLERLEMLTLNYKFIGRGLLSFRCHNAVCKYHFVCGDEEMGRQALTVFVSDPPKKSPALRITQESQVTQGELYSIARKLKKKYQYALLMVLPAGRNHLDIRQQWGHIQNNIMKPLQAKRDPGLIYVDENGPSFPNYVMYVFPSDGAFTKANITSYVPDFLHEIAPVPQLLILITHV